MIYANNWIQNTSIIKTANKVEFQSNLSSEEISQTVHSLNKILDDLKNVNISSELKKSFSQKISKVIKSATFASEGIYDNFQLNQIYTPTGPIPFPKNIDLDDKGNSFNIVSPDEEPF